VEKKELLEKLQEKHAAAVTRAQETLIEIAGLPGWELTKTELFPGTEVSPPCGKETDLFRQLSEDWKRCEAIAQVIQELVPRLFQEPETPDARSKRLHAEAGSMGLSFEQTKAYVQQGMAQPGLAS
jgi:hypothetical protein